MVTLEELLNDDGFKWRRHKSMPRLRGGTAELGAASLRSQRFGYTRSGTRPVRTRSDVNPRIYHSTLKGNRRVIESRLSNAEGRRLMPLQELDDRVFGSFKGSKRLDGSSGKNHWRVCSIEELDVNSMSLMATESSNSKFDERHAKLGYNRHLNYKFDENGERKGKKARNLTAKPCFKDLKDARSVPEMEDGALKSITSIIYGCVNQLIKDERFRLSVHQACVSSLKSSLVQDWQPNVHGVISTLKEAIGAVERIITEGPNHLELKKTSFNLSVITCLKSVESDDGQTCGIPNSHIAACGHLYLSILYKIQKKDKVSAKHLLQVFCDSPYQARTALLPGLWDHLFLRSLSHLKIWYDKEAESILVIPHMMMKLEFLQKVYDDFMDMGTSQVAAYYKAWVMEDKGSAFSFPYMPIPFASFPDTVKSANQVASFESYSSSISVPSMISKRLYESVLSQVKRKEINQSGKEEEKDNVGDETREGKTDDWGRKHDNALQRDNESQYNTAEHSFEYCDTGSQDSTTSSEENYHTEENFCSSNSSIPEAEKIKLEGEVVRFSQDIKEHINVSNLDLQENEIELKLKLLAQVALQSKKTNLSNDANTYNLKLSINLPVCDSYQDEVTELARTKLETNETDTTNELVGSCSLKKKYRDIFRGDYEKNDQGSLFYRIPAEFICPLNGHLLKNPVILESGYTFELSSIQDRFNQGNLTCPVTGQTLSASPFPETNIVLKHMIYQWMEECFRNSIFLTSQSTLRPLKQACNLNYELSLLIIKQLLTGFSSKEVKENIEHLISLGGFQFLTHLLEFGSLEEKSCAAEVLVQCIQADGSCRNHVAMNISKSSLLELIHSKQVHARASAASLLIELICLNRRMDIKSFLSGLKTEDIDKAKHELLMCLESSLPEERVLVAVLLLHIDYKDEFQPSSVYKKEAVKCIVRTIECCLSYEKYIENCQRALLMLGGYISYSGGIVTETWLLNKAGYHCETLSCIDEVDQTISEVELRRKEDWLRATSLVILRYGNKSFHMALSKCWKSGNQDLVKMFVVTTAWLCLALPFIHFPAIQLSAFSALLPMLKECLRSDPDIKHRVLASFSLLNISKILECRLPLISYADELHGPLKSLKEVTWTAEHLYNDIFGETP